MKIHNSSDKRLYTSPRKAHHVTAKERRGLEMVQGCLTSPLTAHRAGAVR